MECCGMRSHNIVIYGTKSRAIELYQKLCGLPGLSFSFFLANAPTDVYNFDKPYGGADEHNFSCTESLEGIPVISVNLVHRYIDNIDAVILPQRNIADAMILYQLRMQGVGWDKIYIAQPDANQDNLRGTVVPYLDAGFLPYLEFHIEDRCNLNCKGCEHYAPLVRKSVQPDIYQFEKDLMQLKKQIQEINRIRILGGEPLLNGQITEYVRLVRNVYPDAVIRIVTNAILLGKMSEEFFEELKRSQAGIDISVYPPMADRVEGIVSDLQDKGITVSATPVLNTFYMRNTLEAEKNLEKAYTRCFQSFCHNLYNGRIAACFMPFVQHYFNETFDMCIPEDGMIDLYEDGLNTRSLKERLYQPLERCRYCGKPVGVTWQQAHKEPSLDDWIVPG